MWIWVCYNMKYDLMIWSLISSFLPSDICFRLGRRKPSLPLCLCLSFSLSLLSLDVPVRQFITGALMFYSLFWFLSLLSPLFFYVSICLSVFCCVHIQSLKLHSNEARYISGHGAVSVSPWCCKHHDCVLCADDAVVQVHDFVVNFISVICVIWVQFSWVHAHHMVSWDPSMWHLRFRGFFVRDQEYISFSLFDFGFSFVLLPYPRLNSAV